MTFHRLYCLLFLLTVQSALHAQDKKPSSTTLTIDTLKFSIDTIGKEKDIVDLYRYITNRKTNINLYKAKTDRLQFALIPAGGYSLQTGFAILLAANTVFYTDKNDHSKTSTILGSIAYTQYNQVIIPINVNIWTKGKKYNLISDIRYMSYPSLTYGLGANTKFSDGYSINFNYLKIHQTILKRVAPNFFSGVGYYYDYLWNEREVNPPTSVISGFEQYGLYSHETASGFCLQTLFDNRENQVNPSGGIYASLRYRLNEKWMGSSAGWHSGIFEFKKYLQFPQNSKNILALWNYNWLTLSGKPPYVLLPSTGWDDFFNTGRGYIQGRYRAKNMSYMEAEYRFRLVENGLVGGVLFGNLQTFSNTISTQYRVLIPGYGFGLRLKLNKHSATNLCIDYAFGKDGSKGFFINLGEVF